MKKVGFPQLRRLNSRKSASCGQCSFSPDLTADEIPATGGHRRFVPTRGMMPLDPALAEVVDAVVKRFPAADWKERPSLTRCASGPAAESGQPGCKASGESQGIIPRKKRAFSLGFSRLSWARSLHTIVKPSAAGGGCLVFPMYSLRLRESRGRRPLVGGLGAESLQRSLCWRFLCPDYRAYTRK